MYNQNKKSFSFNEKKAINSLLYVLKDVDNLYNIMKIFYFADKEHLSKYGRFIYGENYIAMSKGQVPSWIYDLIKAVRGDGKRMINEEVKKNIEVKDDHIIIKKTEPNLDYLSDSEIECLDNAIKKYGKAHYLNIFWWAHKDQAYKKTELNNEIQLDDIIDTLDNKEKVKKYLATMYD